MGTQTGSTLKNIGNALGFLAAPLLVAALVAAQGCDLSEQSTTGVITPDSNKGNVASTDFSGKVSSIRSANGGIEGLSARGPSGQRSLAPGDDISAGETVEADAGLEAVVAFRDDSAMVLREGSRISLPSGGTGEGLSLEAGEISISRPMYASGNLPLIAAGTRFSVVTGRATVSLDKPGQGRLRVEAGEVEIPSTRERLRAGQSAGLASGAISIDQGASMAPSYRGGYIQPLAPEYNRIPEPKNLLRGIGTLTARVPGSGRTNERALDMIRHDIDVTVRDGVALTRIEEAFTNNSGRTVEATYKFLIPSSASITRLALDVDGRIEEGEVLDKKRAARIFRQIVEDSVRPRDPALLEWEKGSSFSMKIFPIKAGETRRVFISYMEPMTSDNGVTRYVYPLGGPAGSPDIAEFTFDADIHTPYGISSIRTPLYPTEVQAAGEQANVSFRAASYAPSADLVLEYSAREDAAPVRVAVETEKNGKAYAMALVRAGLEATPTPTDSRLLLIADTSYGIGDDLRALATSTAVELVAGLGSADSFNVLACDSGCRPLFADFQRPGAEALARVHEFLSSTEPGGASDILGAMEHAFALSNDGVPTSAVYLGDGVPTSGETDPGRLVRLLEQTRPANVSVQTVGIGPDVDSVLLEAMSDSLGGSSYRLSVGESPASAAWNVARKVRTRGIRDVTIQYPSGVVDGYPKRVGFIPSGSELMLTASLARPGSNAGDVVIRGTAPDGSPWVKRFALDAVSGPPAAGFISKLWAKERIDALELAGGREKELVEFSSRMRVASRLTSWLVLENERMYERFKVDRTDAEEWDGAQTTFTEVAEADEEIAAGDDDLDSLATGEIGLGGLSGAAPSFEKAGGGSGGGGVGASGGAGKSDGAFASAQPRGAAPAPKYAEEDRERAARSESKKSKASSGDMKSIAGELEAEASPVLAKDSYDSSDEPLADITGGLATAGPPPMKESGYSTRPYRDCGPHTVYDISIGRAKSYGAAARSRATALKSQVDQHPLSRTAHKKYVRFVSRLGDLGMLTAATEAWRAADPMGTEALGAYADQLARRGDRGRAARIYASIAEIDPGSAKIHLRLAEAFRDLGEYDAAAGHYRAAAGAAKGKNEHMLDYLFCLAASGQLPLLDMEAASVLADGKHRSIHREVNDLLAGTRSGLLPSWPVKAVGGAMTVRLEVDQPGVDLDLSVIDPAGRRISGLWRRTASVKDLSVAHEEALNVSSIWNGNWQILVSRSDGSSMGTYSGKVIIKVRDKRKTLPFTIEGSEAAVAQVKYKKSQKYSCKY